MLSNVMDSVNQLQQYCSNQAYRHDEAKAQLKELIQKFKESHENFSPWFKSQFSYEALIPILCNALTSVRHINHQIQLRKIPEKESLLQVPIIPLHTQSTTFTHLIDAFNFYASQLVSNLQKIDHLLAFDLTFAIDQAQLLPPPTKSYSLEKWYQLLQFELNCLNQFSLPSDLAEQLYLVVNAPVVLWVQSLFESRFKVVSSIAELSNILDQLLITSVSKTLSESMYFSKLEDLKETAPPGPNSKQNTEVSVRYLSQLHQQKPIKRRESPQQSKVKSCFCPLQ